MNNSNITNDKVEICGQIFDVRKSVCIHCEDFLECAKLYRSKD